MVPGLFVMDRPSCRISADHDIFSLYNSAILIYYLEKGIFLLVI